MRDPVAMRVFGGGQCRGDVAKEVGDMDRDVCVEIEGRGRSIRIDLMASNCDLMLFEEEGECEGMGEVMFRGVFGRPEGCYGFEGFGSLRVECGELPP